MSGAPDVGPAAALLLLASALLGTAWSLSLLSVPPGPRLTPGTHRLPSVEPVRNATRRVASWTVVSAVVTAWSVLELV